MVLDYNLVLKSDELYVVGTIVTDGSGERAAGLYLRDTRHLSRFRVLLNGASPEVLSAQATSATSATVIATNTAFLDGRGQQIRPHHLVLTQRVTLDTSLHVQIGLQNVALTAMSLGLDLEFDSDFRDLFDIRGFPRDARGDILEPEVHDRGATLRYRGLDGVEVQTEIASDRDLRFRPLPISEDRAPHLPVAAHHGVAARVELTLAPGEEWALMLEVRPFPAGASQHLGRSAPRASRTRVTTDNPLFNRVIERCERDLAALVTSFPEGQIPAAGIPWYVAPFGRDSLIVGLQTLHLAPEQAADTLRVLAALQGKEHDAWREEETGKILHEMRYGEMARLGEVPHTPYFGTVDATPLFVWLFAETVDWTDDDTLYRDLLPSIRRAIIWIEEYGDKDGDGLIDYRSDAKGRGQIAHQVWKDSFDSLHYPDGRPVEGLISPVEVQGYTFAAYSRLADVVETRGEADWARELRDQASALREHVERAFWLEDEGFYAQALDAEKQPVSAIASNGAQLLVTGLPSPARATRVAARLRQPDLDSGWGTRTLSSSARSYNPMSYHNGSVWPHDCSLIGAGLYRVGEVDTGHAIAEALFAAAQTDPLGRLPELYCGFPRTSSSDEAPVAYPVSCSPQAWAAGALPLLLRAMLGLRAPRDGGDRLIVAPSLPAWLNEVDLRDLSFRGQWGILRVRRTGDGYDVRADGIAIDASNQAAT